MSKTLSRAIERYRPLIYTIGYLTPSFCGLIAATMIGLVLWQAAPEELEQLAQTSEDLDNAHIDTLTTASILDSNLDLRNQPLGYGEQILPKKLRNDPLITEAIRISKQFRSKFDRKLHQWEDASFYVKAILNDGNRNEALWFKVTESVTDGYFVELDDEAAPSKILSGDTIIHFTIDEILDWRIERAGLVYGAYTTRVELSRSDSLSSHEKITAFKDL